MLQLRKDSAGFSLFPSLCLSKATPPYLHARGRVRREHQRVAGAGAAGRREAGRGEGQGARLQAAQAASVCRELWGARSGRQRQTLPLQLLDCREDLVQEGDVQRAA